MPRSSRRKAFRSSRRGHRNRLPICGVPHGTTFKEQAIFPLVLVISPRRASRVEGPVAATLLPGLFLLPHCPDTEGPSSTSAMRGRSRQYSLPHNDDLPPQRGEGSGAALRKNAVPQNLSARRWQLLKTEDSVAPVFVGTTGLMEVPRSDIRASAAAPRHLRLENLASNRVCPFAFSCRPAQTGAQPVGEDARVETPLAISRRACSRR